MSVTDTHSQTPGSVTTSGRTVCPKCGTFPKDGKVSCCARGGSWFKTCGDGQQSEHTWGEGIRACETSSDFSAQQKNPSHHKKPESGVRQGNDPHLADSRTYDGLNKITLFTAGSLLLSNMYTLY